MTIEDLIKDVKDFDLDKEREEIINTGGDAIEDAIEALFENMLKLHDDQPLDAPLTKFMLATLALPISVATRTAALALVSMSVDTDEDLDIERLQKLLPVFSDVAQKAFEQGLENGLSHACAEFGFGVVPINLAGNDPMDIINRALAGEFGPDVIAKLKAFKDANDSAGAVKYVAELVRKHG